MDYHVWVAMSSSELGRQESRSVAGLFKVAVVLFQFGTSYSKQPV